MGINERLATPARYTHGTSSSHVNESRRPIPLTYFLRFVYVAIIIAARHEDDNDVVARICYAWYARPLLRNADNVIRLSPSSHHPPRTVPLSV